MLWEICENSMVIFVRFFTRWAVFLSAAGGKVKIAHSQRLEMHYSWMSVGPD